MLLAVNAQEAVRSLMAAKQRTMLALLGVIIGIGSVMAMVSVGETVKQEALAQFKQMGTDILTISQGMDFSPQGRASAPLVLTAKDFDRLELYSHYVAALSPEVDVWGKMKAGRADISISLKGVRPVHQKINRIALKEGRFLSDFDKERYFVVLGSRVADDLIRKGAPRPLRRVTVDGRPFEVIGVLKPAQLGYRSDEVDQAAFIPLDVAQRMSSQPGLGRAIVKLTPGADPNVASAELQDLMRILRGPQAMLSIQSPRQLLEQMARQMRLFTLLLAAVGSISLVVGGVGIMNMMLATVAERRREIGIRRALGARQGDIASQFLVESVTLSLSGGAVGVALGAAACLVTSSVQGWKAVTPLWAMGLCLAVAMAVGLFFGYYPARKAARQDVIQALRSE